MTPNPKFMKQPFQAILRFLPNGLPAETNRFLLTSYLFLGSVVHCRHNESHCQQLT